MLHNAALVYVVALAYKGASKTLSDALALNGLNIDVAQVPFKAIADALGRI